MAIKKVSKRMLDRYKVMRVLFHRNHMYQNLLTETGLNNKEIVSALGNLLGQSLISKEKIYIETPKELDLTDVGIAKSLLGAEKKKKFTHEYSLTKTGEQRLAYYEWKWQMYQRWSPAWERGDEYPKSITEIIKNQNYFGKQPRD